MTTTAVWETAAAVLVSLGGGGLIVLGLSSWLGKVWAERILEREKATLQLEYASARLALDKQLHAHNVAMSRVDAQRVEAIQELYAALIGWHEAAVHIIAPNNLDRREPTEAVKTYEIWAKALRAKSEALESVAMRTAIYFTEDTYRVIARCGYAASMMSIDFIGAVFNHAERRTEGHRKQIESARQDLAKKYEADYEQARSAVISTFRHIVDPTEVH